MWKTCVFMGNDEFSDKWGVCGCFGQVVGFFSPCQFAGCPMMMNLWQKTHIEEDDEG